MTIRKRLPSENRTGRLVGDSTSRDDLLRMEIPVAGAGPLRLTGAVKSRREQNNGLGIRPIFIIAAVGRRGIRFFIDDAARCASLFSTLSV